MDKYDIEELKKMFKIVCRKCGSEKVDISAEEGIDYGGETGYQSGSISIGCNACEENDFHARV